MYIGSAFRDTQTAVINSLLLKRDLFQFLATLAESPDALTYVPVIDDGFWLVNRPPAIRQVLTADERMIGKPGFLAESNRGSHGDGLASLGGPEWEVRRRLVSRALTPVLYARVASEARAATMVALADLPQGTPVDFAQLLSKLVTTIGARWILSAKVTDSVHDDAIPWAEAAGVRCCTRLQGIAADLMPSQRLRAGPAPILRDIVRTRWRAQHSTGDFISTLRESCSAQQVELSEAEVFDEIVQLLFASHHSITTTLVHCIDFMHRHPASAAAVVACARIDSSGTLAGGRNYTEYFIKEVMRFCMPTPLLFRQALVAQTIAGHAIAPGALLAISPFLLHLDPRHFPRPQHFDPSRFSAAIDAYAYLPFGAGKRQCNFKRMAMTQMHAIVETLVLAGRFVPVTEAPTNRFSVSYPGTEYQVRFEPGQA